MRPAFETLGAYRTPGRRTRYHVVYSADYARYGRAVCGADLRCASHTVALAQPPLPPDANIISGRRLCKHCRAWMAARTS